jgi:hypothetical protein
VPAAPTAPRGSALTEQELAEALDAQRRENDALRARLVAMEERARAGDATAAAELRARADEQERIDLLERRLAKLRLSLEDAENRLSRASYSVDGDGGIASRYPTVQGLDPDAPYRAIKVTLMKAIFDANLELSERLRGLHGAQP